VTGPIPNLAIRVALDYPVRAAREWLGKTSQARPSEGSRRTSSRRSQSAVGSSSANSPKTRGPRE